jgi:hypothetical protein
MSDEHDRYTGYTGSTRRTRHASDPTPRASDDPARDGLPPIATLLTPDERTRVDAAGEGYYRTLHRENVDDLVRDLKSRQVHAVLLSVSCAGLHSARVASMVREFPRVPAVALLSELEIRTPQTVLVLGQSGIRRLVDVRQASGWRELRGALMADGGDAAHRSLLHQLRLDLADVPDDCCLHLRPTHRQRARAVARARGASEHADESLLSRRRSGAETLPRDGAPRPRRPPVREQRLFDRQRVEPSRLQLAAELRATRAHPARDHGGRLPPSLRRRWHVRAIP